MKTNRNKRSLWSAFRCIAATLLALLLGATALPSQAQFNSPIGTWDCVLSGGGQKGIVFLTFTNELNDQGVFKLYGHMIVTSPGGVGGGSDDDEGRGGDSGRGDTTDNSDGGDTTRFVGFDRVTGQWTFDANGRIIGNLIHADPFEDQSFSFIAKVRPGAPPRLTLVYSTPNGKVTVRGRTAQPLIDLSGPWQGVKTENGLQSLEFFTMGASTSFNPFAAEFPEADLFNNLYFTTNGVGPGYTFTGAVMVSSFKRIGIVSRVDGGDLRSTIGTFIAKPTVVGAKTRGLHGDTRIGYTARQTVAP
jgi:hypothetical protein